jgi:hypothetical protein
LALLFLLHPFLALCQPVPGQSTNEGFPLAWGAALIEAGGEAVFGEEVVVFPVSGEGAFPIDRAPWLDRFIGRSSYFSSHLERRKRSVIF